MPDGEIQGELAEEYLLAGKDEDAEWLCDCVSVLTGDRDALAISQDPFCTTRRKNAEADGTST